MARPLWSGQISFGLVTIPVQLFSAVQEHDIHFHMMSPNGECRLHRKLYCPETGKEFDQGDTVKGLEVAPNRYVIVEPEELESIEPERGHSIEIKQFAYLNEIDPVYFDKPYYLLPKDEGAKAYNLLLDVLRDSKRVAIAKFVMREKEYLAVLRPQEKAIVLETMRYADEVRPLEDMKLAPKKARVEKREAALAAQLVDALTSPFDIEAFKDEYRERVEDLVDAKKKGKTIEVEEEEEEQPTRVLNLMEKLEQSLGNGRGARQGRTKSKAASSRGGAKSNGSSKKRAHAASAKRKSAHGRGHHRAA